MDLLERSATNNASPAKNLTPFWNWKIHRLRRRRIVQREATLSADPKLWTLEAGSCTGGEHFSLNERGFTRGGGLGRARKWWRRKHNRNLLKTQTGKCWIGGVILLERRITWLEWSETGEQEREVEKLQIGEGMTKRKVIGFWGVKIAGGRKRKRNKRNMRS